MKSTNSLYLPALFLVATFLLGACASHPVASNTHRANVASSNPSGVIPTTDGRHSSYVAGNSVGGGNGEEYSVPAGSQIPQHYNRRGYTTDAADPAFVYDQNDIRVQSQENVSDQLRTIPGVSIRGDH